MKELKLIIDQYKKSAGQGGVMATIVHVEGSSYRRASARMFVDQHGMMTGAISGGCLEGDALRKALFAQVRQQNMIITYDTSDEQDAIVGAQLGCNGIIQVLFEPVNKEKPRAIALLEKALLSSKEGILVTLFNIQEKEEKQLGTSLYIDAEKKITGNLDDALLEKQIFNDALHVFKEKQSCFRIYKKGKAVQHAFIEYIPADINLVIVGAGNDAQPLASLAEILGWKVYVVDGRTTHAKPERFASSCNVLVSKPNQLLEKTPITPTSFYVLMTHNYHYDLSVLKWLIKQKDIPYIGILGPLKKYEKMLDDLKDEGITLSKAQKDSIYSPVGLELGAETSQEIALAILAEIQAERCAATGLSLREKKEPIHTRKGMSFLSVDL